MRILSHPVYPQYYFNAKKITEIFFRSLQKAFSVCFILSTSQLELATWGQRLSVLDSTGLEVWKDLSMIWAPGMPSSSASPSCISHHIHTHFPPVPLPLSGLFLVDKGEEGNFTRSGEDKTRGETPRLSRGQEPRKLSVHLSVSERTGPLPSACWLAEWPSPAPAKRWGRAESP